MFIEGDDGYMYLMFQVAELRKTALLNPTVTCYFFKHSDPTHVLD